MSVSRGTSRPRATTTRWFASIACAGGLVLCGGSAHDDAAPVIPGFLSGEPDGPPVLDAPVEADDARAAAPIGPPSASAPPAAPPPPLSREVPRRVTPLSQVDLGNALFAAHLRVFGQEPSHRRLASAWAHAALENARGDAVECNNIGNLTVLPDAPADYFIRTFHGRTTPDPLAPLTTYRRTDVRFRAYASPVDGATGYWQQLALHYGRALALFDAGAPELGALNLVQNGYASAPAEPYAAAIANLYLEYWTRIEPHLTQRPQRH